MLALSTRVVAESPTAAGGPLGGAGERGTYHHGDLRRALVQSALELLQAEGAAAALTLRAVARRVGVSHAAPYRHFADRTALIVAVAEEGFVALQRALEGALAGAEADPVRQLLDPAVAYLRFAASHPAHFRVMFGPEVAGSVAKGTTPVAAGAAFQVLIDSVVRAQAAGIVRDGEAVSRAIGLWSVAHGAAMLHIDGMIPGEAFEQVAVTLVAQHFEGLATERGRALLAQGG